MFLSFIFETILKRRIMARRKTGIKKASSTIHLQERLMNRFREVAKAERRTISGFIELLIERELEARGELSA
jgi:hypothetical protein